MNKELNLIGKVKVSFDIPQKLLNEIDTDRKKTGQNRRTWLTLAVMDRLAKIKKEKENSNSE